MAGLTALLCIFVVGALLTGRGSADANCMSSSCQESVCCWWYYICMYWIAVDITLNTYVPCILLNSAASLVLPLQGCSSATGSVLYYKVMTSKWLSEHASLSHLVAATSTSLHYKVTQNHARLIKVPLFHKGELPTDDNSVTITVHLEDPPTSDLDFLAGICDGTVCNASFISDKGNYPTQHPT